MSHSFAFTAENEKQMDQILTRYPRKRAAMLPALHLVQQQDGYVSRDAEKFISELLEVPLVDVREVLSFYSLFFRRPMGKHHIRLCQSISCWIRGCDEIAGILEEKIGVKSGAVSKDGEFSWEAIPDCLGACEMAPMMQIDGYFEGPLTEKKVDQILEAKRNGKG